MKGEEFQKLIQTNITDSVVFLEVLSKAQGITHLCKQHICIESLQFWYGVVQTANLASLDGVDMKQHLSAIITEGTLLDTIIQRLRNSGIADVLLDFVLEYTAPFREAVLSIYESKLLESPQEVARLATEVANIRYIEFKGMEFSCSCLKPAPSCTSCVYCSNEACYTSSRVWKLSPVPEYLISDDIVPRMAETIDKYFNDNSLIVLLSGVNLSRLSEEDKKKFLPLVDIIRCKAQKIAVVGDKCISKVLNIPLLQSLSDVDEFMKKCACYV